jgi:hypothetical protein
MPQVFSHSQLKPNSPLLPISHENNVDLSLHISFAALIHELRHLTSGAADNASTGVRSSQGAACILQDIINKQSFVSSSTPAETP